MANTATIAMNKIDNEGEPAIQLRELYFMPCADLNGKETRKGEGIRTAGIAGSFCVEWKLTHYKAPILLFSQSHVLPFCDPMGCVPPGSSIHGIFQASILEWVAISFSRGSS